MRQKRETVARACGLAAVLCVVAAGAASAQYVAVPGAAAYALRDVTVVQADGRRAEGVTLVVRGGRIEALGRNVAVPADAEVLEGEGLHVYPGLVDGDGKAAHEFPRAEIDRRTLELWNAPRDVRGFTPSRRVASHLTANGESVAAQRRAGIVAAAVHPTGSMMPGQGTLLLYRKDATRPDQLVLQPTLGPRFELRGGPGVYPATLFGVMASYRQALEDSRHLTAATTAYARDPRGLPTPMHDADHAVLQRVLAGDAPVFFRADGAADIQRALGLAQEYGFRPVIVGGAEAWKVADELARRRVPVLVATDFAEPRRWKPAKEGEPEPALDAAAQREKEELEARWANAGRLARAGVTVALTSGGTGDLLPGARKAVAHGMSADAALAALTRAPAQIYGIPNLVRVEAGMPATFVVASGPLFDEDTRILHTFVEGAREEGGRPRAAAGAAEDAVAFGGEWRMSLDAGGQNMTAVLTIEQDGATFTGTMTLEGMRLQLRDGTIDGDRISAIAIMEQGGQTLEVRINGTVEGDRASGDADAGPLGMARWTATRTGPGGGR